jgi:glycosyltransferase involved in cell wall biosynthesis
MAADVPHAAFIVPGDLDTRTGGYIYDKRIASGLRERGWCVDVRQPADLAALPDRSLALVDGLALLTCVDAWEPQAARLRLVPLIHLPLALEVGLDAAEASRRDAIEQRVVRLAPLVVATGRDTVDQLVQRGFDVSRVALVEPGTDPAPVARGSNGDAVALVSVAALTVGKGHELLLRALAAVPTRAWSLTCAGNLDRDPNTVARIRALTSQLGLDDRVTFAGELDDRSLDELYDRSDAFVLATLRETYGMAVAEAIARGLPVVSTTVGAIPHIVQGGGILVAPNEVMPLATALIEVITDGAIRRRLAGAARVARQALRNWDEASCAMAAALARVTG